MQVIKVVGSIPTLDNELFLPPCSRKKTSMLEMRSATQNTMFRKLVDIWIILEKNLKTGISVVKFESCVKLN